MELITLNKNKLITSVSLLASNAGDPNHLQKSLLPVRTFQKLKSFFSEYFAKNIFFYDSIFFYTKK